LLVGLIEGIGNCEWGHLVLHILHLLFFSFISWCDCLVSYL
jgi:hypothetical protein